MDVDDEVVPIGDVSLAPLALYTRLIMVQLTLQEEVNYIEKSLLASSSERTPAPGEGISALGGEYSSWLGLNARSRPSGPRKKGAAFTRGGIPCVVA
jgi:hypothetical protein